MKKILLFAAMTTLFAACTKHEETVFVGGPADRLCVSMDEEDSRVQLSNGKTVWTKGDRLSVFYKTTGNECWKFDGETGDTTGTLTKVVGSASSTTIENIVAVYPYSTSNGITTDGKITVKISGTQNYVGNSYGIGANVMVGKGQNTELAMKNVCGWLKLQFSGTNAIKKITLRGNNGEKLTGSATIDAESLAVTLDESTATDEIVVDCGEGVQLSEIPTAFYIALVPQVLEKGISVVAECKDGTTIEQSTDKSITIARNHILPVANIDKKPHAPNNEIRYTSSDGNVVTPYNTDAFGATIVSNTYENGMGRMVFDGSITEIGNAAFYGCSNLTNIAIPDSVTSIGEFAFCQCSMTSITIPGSVTSIRKYAFRSCNSLTSITIPDSVTSIGSGTFASCYRLTSFYGKYASADNRCLIIDGTLHSVAPAKLTKYTIPDGVTEIGDMAFYDCKNITNITIPDSVTVIGNSTFYNCSNLTSVTIPGNVTSIEYHAFAYCSSLKSITIPDNVTSIESHAFQNCNSLTSIYFKPATPPTLGTHVFYYYDGTSSFYILYNLKIYVPTQSVSKYKSAKGWNSYTNMIVGYDF